MRPVALSDEIAVGEMPSVDEIAILAKAGFRSLLSVQPDGEVERLLTAAETARSAASSSMNFAHIPLASRRIPDETVAAFANAMITLPRPIYACCYSGARAAAAWAMAVAASMPPTDVAAACSAAGFDISALQPELERRYAKTVAAGSVLQTIPADAVATVQPNAAASALHSSPATSSLGATSTTAPAAVSAAVKVIYPRAAGSGGFAVSG